MSFSFVLPHQKESIEAAMRDVLFADYSVGFAFDIFMGGKIVGISPPDRNLAWANYMASLGGFSPNYYCLRIPDDKDSRALFALKYGAFDHQDHY